MRQYDGPEVEIDPIALGSGRFVTVEGDQMVFLPTVITGRANDGLYDVEFVIINVADHPEPVLAEVKISMKHETGAPPVRPDMVRGVKLGAVYRRAIELGSIPLTRTGDDEYSILPGVGDAKSTRAALRKDRRNTVTADRVKSAAELHTKFSDRPGDTYAKIAAEMNVSRATAHRYVSRARELGLLPEATA